MAKSEFITIEGFKGGYADSLYDPLFKQTFQDAKNLNINRTNILSPLVAFVDIDTPSDGSDNFAALNCIKGSDDRYYFVGNITVTSVRARLYSTATIEASPTWQNDVNVTTTDTLSSAMEEYKDGIFWGTGTNLRRWGDLSGSPSASVISSGLTTGLTFLRENKGIGFLYFIHDSGRLIGSYDDSTVTLNALTLNKDEEAIGLEPFGSFNIVGIRGNSKTDKFYIWDGIATTIDDVMPTGDNGLQAFRVVGQTIHYITARDVATGDRFFRYYQVSIGSKTPRLIKEFPVGTVTGNVTVEPNAVDTIGGRFQFAFRGDTYSLLDQVIWEYGSQNEEFGDIVTPLRTNLAGDTSDVRWLAVRNFDDVMITISTDNSATTPHAIEAIGPSTNVSSQGVYETNAFPLNGGLPAQIKRVYINHEPLVASTGFTVSLKQYGNYPHAGTVPSEDSFSDLTTDQGSGGATGATQSTTNTTFTEIAPKSKTARYAQLRIEFDEVSTTNAAEIIFPILIEVELPISRP